MVSLTIDNNGYVSGTIQNNDGTESSFTVLASEFFVVAPGVGDGEPIPLFLVQEVDGAAAVTINGDVLADGSITARALNVATLSAITADAGTVTAGIIQSANGKYINNLTTGQELWSD